MKNLKITVNGKSYDVQVEEVGTAPAPAAASVAAPAPVPEAVPAQAPAAAPAQAPAAAPATASAPVSEGSETINSPMPGTILDVRVAAGDSVKSGDILLILEAMKMENEIMSPRDGIVASVLVAKGDSVDSGKPLVSLQ